MSKKKGNSKSRSFMVMAQDVAGRMSTSRHQRRKLEKLAKRHPDAFMIASKKYDKEDR